ncbi:hypothetical protein C2G38_2165641 [Gigaspora rosea]|uniref:Uncharacterized protein n=1 Tax=Gigaspora rosea TaxID=44941 RepID=A0A397VX53_9GLOM|nr:hypothetical protein C2G38_2165641 [Gigaspora rosea]
MLHNVQCPTPSGPMDWTELEMGGPMSMSNVQPNTESRTWFNISMRLCTKIEAI